MGPKYEVVGTSPRKVDGVDKVTGAARYTADVYLPGMLYGKIKRSPHPHARIISIDTSKARALAGVKAVLTVDDVPRVLHAGAPAPRIQAHVEDQYILDEKVRHVGDGVAVVAAISETIADEALDLITVEYELLPAVFTVQEAMAPGAPLIHGTDQNLVMPPIVISKGDVEQGFAEADFIVEGTYNTGRPVHAYMEPNVCVVQPDRDGKLTIWSSTQNAFMVRGILAEVLGIPVSNIRVIVDHFGGGFGGKQDIYQHEFLAVLLAQRTGRPVKMEYTREECFLGGKSRHPVTVEMRHGVRNDGTLTARQVRYISNSGGYASHGPGITAVGSYEATSLYRCEQHQDIQGYCVYTNSPVAGAFRGYGAVQTFFAIDTQMDEIAGRLGVDPVAYRLQNVVGEGDLSGTGERLLASGLEACLQRGAEEFGWWERHKTAADQTGPICRGYGVAVEMHPSGAFPSIKELSNAILKMNEDGTFTLLTGVADLGTGALTAMAQIAAEMLGVSLDDIHVVGGDTDAVPFDIGAYASRTTFVGGGAVLRAATDLRQQLLTLAAERLGRPASTLALRNGNVVNLEGEPYLSLAELVQGEGGVPALNLMSQARHEAEVADSFAAHFVELEVDIETGRIAVRRVVAVHEIGQAINRRAVEGQIEGGIQQGLGHTLMEDFVIDPRTGRPLNANLVDYKMPTALDMPEIKTIILEEFPDLRGPYGAKGVGEDPILAIGPAIANAIYDAIGIRFHEYPITPEKVLQALDAKNRTSI